MTPKHVIIACGGTGGHLFPGIAIAYSLKEKGIKPLLLISEKKIDAQASQKYTDLVFITMPSIAKPPTLSLRMISFFFKLISSVYQCKKLIKKYQPIAVLGMGGFTSLPPILAAYQKKIPCFIHESNAIAGRANRLTARWTSRVFVGLEESKSFFPTNKALWIGTPLRKEMQQLPSKNEARKELGLEPSLFCVLVIGGSQGALHMNSIILNMAKAKGDSFQILHLTGPADYQRIKKESDNLSHYHCLAFCQDMPKAYSACDLVICRAGASTLTELSCLSIPSLLIPYPYAADNHQKANALAFSTKKAALLFEEKDLDAGILLAEILGLVDNPAALEAMAYAAKKLSRPQAANDIATLLISPSTPA